MNGNQDEPPTPPSIDHAAHAAARDIPAANPRPIPGSQWVRRFSNDPRWFDTSSGRRRFRLGLERATILFAAILLGSGLIATVGAATGTFRIIAPILWGVWFVAILALIAGAGLRRIAYEYNDWGDFVALGVAILMGLSAGLLHHHYYAAQADIGFYISDATATGTTGGRSLDGPYDFLLPGFSPSEDGAHAVAMFGYSSLAAMFVYAFGMFAAPWVNAPLSFLAVLALYHVARRLTGPMGSTVTLAFWSTSILTIWMSRWTMTENAAIPAFWTSALLGLSLWRRWDTGRALVLLVCLTFGALARPDGIMIFAWFGTIFFARYARTLFFGIRRMVGQPRSARPLRFIVPALLVLVAALIPIGFAVYRALPLGYLRGTYSLALGFFRYGVIADAGDVPVSGPSPHWGDYALRFEWESSLAYYLPWFFVIGIAGIALRIVPWRRALLIALFCAPYLIFIFMPPVTTAHPWFMRRLWMVLIPFGFLLAGAAMDLHRVAWRWPQVVDRRGNIDARPMTAVFPALVTLLLVGLQVQTSVPVMVKREQDSVEPMSGIILDFLPPGSAVIFDEDVVEYSSAIRFHHDGPVVSWFNQRAASFFASIDASEQANKTVIVRIPAVNRNYVDIDARGAVRAELHNATVENTVRRDFRNYISRPPLPQGYAPLEQYLESDVPPNEWVVGTQPFQLVETSDPMFIMKNIRFDPNHWGRGPEGLYAVKSPSALLINLSKFRADILQSASLSLHIVYVQAGTDTREVTAPGLESPIGRLESDGSNTLRRASLPLPSPMNLTTIHLPQGTILRGILMDLA